MNKKDFDKKYVDGNIVVNCKTEELAKEFLKLADSFGYKWRKSDSFTYRTNWEINRKNTVYYVCDGQYGYLEIAKMNGYKIIEFKGENMKVFPEIHITTDGKTTYGVLKQGKEVVKRVEAKLHPDDEFDFETGSKLVMERLFEKEKELRLIDNFGIDKGRVGEETDLEDIFGEKLYVGDEVNIIARSDYNTRVGFIVKHGINGYKVQGFADYDFVQGQYGNKYILVKNGKFEDLKEGKNIKSFLSTITVKLV